MYKIIDETFDIDGYHSLIFINHNNINCLFTPKGLAMHQFQADVIWIEHRTQQFD
jgi:hypothetical protein